jgi:hypothetical protein
MKGTEGTDNEIPGLVESHRHCNEQDASLKIFQQLV